MKFFKIGIEIFDNKRIESGGHWRFLGVITKLDYLVISLQFETFQIKYYTDFYDGYHHAIQLGYLWFSWGGPPFDIKWE
jgi:hypothetical protein